MLDSLNVVIWVLIISAGLLAFVVLYNCLLYTSVTQDIAWYLVSIFGSVFLMVIKLALPFVAAEFVLEVSMGVLMKLIPQIHVFVINIQSKILLGILLMMLFARPIGAFIDSYYGMMMSEVQKVMMMFAS